MLDRIKVLRSQVMIGIVSGSDAPKLREQLGEGVDLFDYYFPENGMVAYAHGKLIKETSMKEIIDDEVYNTLVTFCASYVDALNIPVKR